MSESNSRNWKKELFWHWSHWYMQNQMRSCKRYFHILQRFLTLTSLYILPWFSYICLKGEDSIILTKAQTRFFCLVLCQFCAWWRHWETLWRLEITLLPYQCFHWHSDLICITNANKKLPINLILPKYNLTLSTSTIHPTNILYDYQQIKSNGNVNRNVVG